MLGGGRETVAIGDLVVYMQYPPRRTQVEIDGDEANEDAIRKDLEKVAVAPSTCLA